MKIVKKLNNNVVLALNDKDEEIIVVGKGLGFRKTPYVLEDLSLIEKKYVIPENTKAFDILDSIPNEVIKVTEMIMRYGYKELNIGFSPDILLALSDHINFAIQRNNEGIEMRNPLQWEIKHLYPKEYSIGNNSLDVIYSNTKTSKYNLSLEFIPKSNTLNLEYNTDLFKKITVTNILEHYISILKQISNMPDILISKVNMITEKEKKLLSDFNKTDGEINNDTVADLIERQAKLHPDNIAIICEDKFMTYSELDKKSNSLANYLVNNGIKANDIICIMTNRSFETIVAMVAILKAGGAFLNIDPTYPIDRTKYYIESSKTQYVLTQKSLKDKVKEIPNCVEIDLQDNPIYDDNFARPKITINIQD